MTAPSSAPRPVTTRLLLVRDDALDAATSEALGALVAAHGPVVLCVGAPAAGSIAAVLAVSAGAPLRVDERLAAGEDEALAAARDLAAVHAGASVVIVAGDPVVRALLCYGLGVPRAAGQRFRVDPGALSVVEAGGEGRWAVVCLNERCHLPG